MKYIVNKAFKIYDQPAYRIWDKLKKQGIDIDVIDIRILLDKIEKKLSEIESMISVTVLIEYKDVKNSTNTNTIFDILENLKNVKENRPCVHIININGDLIQTEYLEDLGDDMPIGVEKISGNIASGFSEHHSTSVIHYELYTMKIFHDGLPIYAKPFRMFNVPYGKILSNMKSIRNYNELIKDHFDNFVKYASETDHWEKKSERILRSAPEDIFKKSLWMYLKLFALDVIDVAPEFSLPSDSEVDIVALKQNGQHVLIEVKVVGKYHSEKSKYNEYPKSRVDEGMYQLKAYVDEYDSNTECGCLVVYDGREKNEPIDFDMKDMPEKVDYPQILYLESINASQKGKLDSKAKKTS